MSDGPPIARFGGRDAVERVVEAFYVHVEADSHMRPIYPEDLEPGKAKLKLFLEQWLGGEARYTEHYGHPRLRLRHFPFVIDERAAGLWLRYMRMAMDEEGVPAEVSEQIFPALARLAHHMVNAGEDVSREPLGDVRLA